MHVTLSLDGNTIDQVEAIPVQGFAVAGADVFVGGPCPSPPNVLHVFHARAVLQRARYVGGTFVFEPVKAASATTSFFCPATL